MSTIESNQEEKLTLSFLPERLETLCLRGLASIIATYTLNNIIEKDHNCPIHLSNLLESLRLHVSGLIPSCPESIFTSLLDQLREISPLAAIYVDSAYSDKILSYPTIPKSYNGVRMHFAAQLVHIFPLLPAASAITELNLSNMSMNDDVLMCLAVAPIAGALKSLIVGDLNTTDAVAVSWREFRCLEILDCGNTSSLCLETIRILGSLPHLRDLRFTHQGLKRDAKKFMEAILHPNAFLELENLFADFKDAESGISLVSLSELIQQRRNRDNLTRVMVNYPAKPTQWTLTPEDLAEFAQLCPNLLELPSYLPASPSLTPDGHFNLPILNNLSVLHLPSTYLIKSDAELRFVSDCYPSLEHLEIGYQLQENIERLDYFINLRSSKISALGMRIRKWPSTLQQLSVSTDLPLSEPVDVVDVFIKNLCQSCPKLQELNISFGIRFPSLHHIELLLSSFPHLKQLNIFSSGHPSSPNQIEVPIYHPNLVSLPSLPPAGFVAIPVWMPKLQNLVEAASDRYSMSVDYKKATIPSVSSLFAKNDSTMESLITACNKYFITELMISSGSTRIPINTICKLRFLTDLTLLRTVPTSSSSLLLSNLPMLTYLYINVEEEPNNGSWICHGRLAFLVLFIQSSDHSQAPKTDSHYTDVYSLEFTKARTPNLRRLYVKLRSKKFFSISVADLPYLDDLRLFMWLDMSLTVDTCPLLTNISLAGQASLRALQLRQLPRLISAHLSNRFKTGQKCNCVIENVAPTAQAEILSAETQWMQRCSVLEISDKIKQIEDKKR